MTDAEKDEFCIKCRRYGEEESIKEKFLGCMRTSVCKDCKDFYSCVGFCIAEREKENDKL